MKKTGNPKAGDENIQSCYKDGICYWKMAQAKNWKWKMINDGMDRDLKSRKKIRMLREKENCKY